MQLKKQKRILDRCTLSKQQWHRMLQELPGISGAMLDGEELDAETATGVLDQNYGRNLDMVFDEGWQCNHGAGRETPLGTYEYVDEYTPYWYLWTTAKHTELCMCIC